MKMSISCQEWRCDCGYTTDTQEAMTSHNQEMHQGGAQARFIELHLDLQSKTVSDTLHPLGRLTERYLNDIVEGRATLRIQEGGTIRNIVLLIGSRDAIRLQYAPYDAFISIAASDLPLTENEMEMTQGLLSQAMVMLHAAAPYSTDILIRNHNMPMKTMTQIMRSLPRRIRQMQRGGRPRGKASMARQKRDHRIRRFYEAAYPITQARVAQKFGVSKATVQRALKRTLKD